MKLVIIESPYKGNNYEDLDLNLRYLRAALRDCLLRGEAPFASHGLYTQDGVLNDRIPEERKLGIEAGFAYRRLCDYTVVYEDLGVTPGMQYGIDHALAYGHQVFYRRIPGWPLTDNDSVQL